jgi:hypothetical protein
MDHTTTNEDQRAKVISTEALELLCERGDAAELIRRLPTDLPILIYSNGRS